MIAGAAEKIWRPLAVCCRYRTDQPDDIGTLVPSSGCDLDAGPKVCRASTATQCPVLHHVLGSTVGGILNRLFAGAQRAMRPPTPPPPVPDHYFTLGVARTATSDEISAAWRSLAKEWHPDRCTKPHAHQRFADINEAHRVLSDPSLRELHDRGEAV